MRKKLGLVFLSVFISLALSTSVFAAGFALYETGARGTSLGGAMVARADDPSALFFNPAGITQLTGIQTMLGVQMIAPRLDVKTTGQYTVVGPNAPPLPPYYPAITGTQQTTTSLEDNEFWPPHAYLTYPVNDRWWLGLAVMSRFGLGVEFPTSWPGRFNSYNSRIVTSEVNPNIAYKVSDNFSVSAGVSMMYLDVKLQKKINPALYGLGAGEIDQKLTGDSYGYGYNFGLHYKPTDWISFGASYRSTVTQHVEGDLKFRGQSGPYQAGAFPNVGGDATLVLPDQFFFGVAVKPMKKLSVEVGAILTNWSSYDQLKLELDSPILGGRANVISQPKNWKNVWRYHAGLEYNVTDWMDLRLSYIYDESPVPDETIGYELPDSDRNIFGIGLGFHKNNWWLDLSYNHLLFSDREIAARPIDGVLASEVQDGMAYIAGISFGYKW